MRRYCATARRTVPKLRAQPRYGLATTILRQGPGAPLWRNAGKHRFRSIDLNNL
jgi:hypothetical protein